MKRQANKPASSSDVAKLLAMVSVEHDEVSTVTRGDDEKQISPEGRSVSRHSFISNASILEVSGLSEGLASGCVGGGESVTGCRVRRPIAAHLSVK